MEWYYADGSQQQITVDESELSGLVSAGSIKPETLVWNETMADWRKAAEARPDLFGLEAAPPSLTPAQVQSVGAPLGSGTVAAAPTSATAICALVFGILGIVTCFPLFALAGIICGHMGRSKAKEIPTASSSGGLSMAGLVMGYIGFVGFIVVAVIYGAIFIAAISSGEFQT